MESTETSRFSRITMTRPFATGSGATKKAVAPSAGNDINYEDGFPAIYASADGRFVSRADMNGVINMATQNQFYFQAGGLNTFDQAFAHAVGGYPAGAVLDFLVGTTLYKVLSLKENNLVDFTGKLPEYSDIEQGGVDGVNWEYVNMDKPRTTVFEAGKIPSSLALDTSTVIFAFVAPKSGSVFLSGDFKQNTPSQPASAEQTIKKWGGAGIWIREWEDGMGAPAMESGYGGWTPIYAFMGMGWFSLTPSSAAYTSINCDTFSVEQGKKYAIASSCGRPNQVASFEVTEWLPLVYDINMSLNIL